MPALIVTTLVAVGALILCFMEAKRADYYREKWENRDEK